MNDYDLKTRLPYEDISIKRKTKTIEKPSMAKSRSIRQLLRLFRGK